MKIDTLSLETESLQGIRKSIDSLQIKTSEGFNEISNSIIFAREKDLFLGIFSYDALFATGASIFVFTAGVFINFFQNRKKERIQASSIREAFFTWIELHKKAYLEQQESFTDFIKRLSESKDIQEERLVVKFIQIKKLLEIPFLKLMNVFVTNSEGIKAKNEKSFFNLMNSLEFLVKFNDLVSKKYEEFRKGTDEIRNEWNEKFFDFDEKKTRISLAFSRCDVPELEAIAREMNSMTVIFFLKEEDTIGQPVQVENMMDGFFQPLRKFLAKQMNLNPQVHELQELSMVIEEIFVVYKKWKAWKSGFIQIFASLKELHDKNFKSVEEQLNHFQKNDLVPFWKFKGLVD